jgi:hypothetical protein
MLFFNGCASVQFYSSGDLQTRTGLRFYTAKPYLLVEQKSEKNMTFKTSIVYLPDLASPQYMSFKPGFGSKELRMAFTDGMIKSYGLNSTSDVPQTINSIARLLGKTPDVLNQMAAADLSNLQPPGEPSFILYEILFSANGTILKRVSTEE